MPYSRSQYRKDFEERVTFLVGEAAKAQKLASALHDIRDMTFQCAVFQTSAALETFLRLSVEGWVQQLKLNAASAALPPSVRGRIAAKRLHPQFERYLLRRDESKIHYYLGSQSDLWSLMIGVGAIPPFIRGEEIHEDCSYPSAKNLTRLFARIGISNVQVEIAKILQRDVEAMIEGFQSVRTALAHAAPPSITLKDVRRLLGDMAALVRAMDRVLYKHVAKYGGTVCWK